LGAILMILAFSQSSLTQTSFNNDLALDIDAWFNELEKTNNNSTDDNN